MLGGRNMWSDAHCCFSTMSMIQKLNTTKYIIMMYFIPRLQIWFFVIKFEKKHTHTYTLSSHVLNNGVYDSVEFNIKIISFIDVVEEHRQVSFTSWNIHKWHLKCPYLIQITQMFLNRTKDAIPNFHKLNVPGSHVLI